MAFEVPEDIW